MTNYLCLDIGGTAVKYGVATEQGRFLFKGCQPNKALVQGKQLFLEQLTELIEDAKIRYDIQGVAVDTAGVVDPDTGTILFASGNIPHYTGTKLKTYLAAGSHLPVEIENDVNAAALGEYWLGAGQGAKSLFCLTVGTGIGGGLILDGKLVHGASFSAGEAGYMKMAGEESWEDVASTRALVREVGRAKNFKEELQGGREVFWLPPELAAAIGEKAKREPGETTGSAARNVKLDADTRAGFEAQEAAASTRSAQELNGRLIFRWAKGGDPEARAAIDRMVAYLSRGIATICYVVNPEVVILGGGIMEQEDYLRPLLNKALARELLPAVYEKTRLEFARLGNDAGMAGALYNFLMRRESGKPTE